MDISGSGVPPPDFTPLAEESQQSEEWDDREKKKKEKKKLEPLTVEDLLNIPLPKSADDKKPTKDDKCK